MSSPSGNRSIISSPGGITGPRTLPDEFNRFFYCKLCIIPVANLSKILRLVNYPRIGGEMTAVFSEMINIGYDRAIEDGISIYCMKCLTDLGHLTSEEYYLKMSTAGFWNGMQGLNSSCTHRMTFEDTTDVLCAQCGRVIAFWADLLRRLPQQRAIFRAVYDVYEADEAFMGIQLMLSCPGCLAHLGYKLVAPDPDDNSEGMSVGDYMLILYGKIW